VPLTNVIIETHVVLLFTVHNTKNIAYHITEVLTFSADKFMVIGNSKNSRVFNFAMLLKFDAREIYMFYSILHRTSCSLHSIFYQRPWKLLQFIITLCYYYKVAFTKDRFVVDTNNYISNENDLKKSFHKQPKTATKCSLYVYLVLFYLVLW